MRPASARGVERLTEPDCSHCGVKGQYRSQGRRAIRAQPAETARSPERTPACAAPCQAVAGVSLAILLCSKTRTP